MYQVYLRVRTCVHRCGAGRATFGNAGLHSATRGAVGSPLRTAVVRLKKGSASSPRVPGTRYVSCVPVRVLLLYTCTSQSVHRSNRRPPLYSRMATITAIATAAWLEDGTNWCPVSGSQCKDSYGTAGRNIILQVSYL